LKTVPFLYQQRGIAKDWSKLLGTVGLWFDPSAGSNVSWVHSLQITEEGRKILVLRHGTPTQDPGVGGVLLREVGNLTSYVPFVGRTLCASTWASVVPEFEAHLAADKTKQTLYVNHQEYDASGHETSHGEGDRSQAIRDLEKRHKNFHFLALPFDGPLWKKRSVPRKVDTLCQLLCDSLIGQKNGFCLPKEMQNVDGNHIMAMLNQIHQLYFSGQEFTSVKEEKAFIMLFYSELKDYAKRVLLINYIVSACKDNKDRGNASTTVDMGKNMVKLGQEDDPERLREIFFSVLGPFIIKNEEIIDSRLEFALAVLEHLASLSPQQRKAIRETPSVSGFKLARQVVPREYTVEEVV
jgi:hypothetical protein